MRRCVIFDLDGTLTRSEEGIFNGVRDVAERMGLPAPEGDALRAFIGPPLMHSFMTRMGLSEADALRALEIYRERYTATGLFENRVYPGVRRLLRALKERGDFVAVATGKPQSPSERILAHFGLDRWIDRVVGPEDGEMNPDKAALIRAALPGDADLEEAFMVGDRRYDVEGGRAVGVRTIGVGYGYGDEAELRGARCDLYADTVDGLIALLCPEILPPRGHFVTMEGLDGSGKSTQLALLTDALDRWGFEVVHSREPGGSPIGEQIRQVILCPANTGMTAETEAMLYAASRAQHVREVIRPALRAGKTLLCDRFLDSSVAYQGGGRGLGVERVLAINAPAVDGLAPDVTVYLDIGHEASLQRRLKAGEPDRLERESSAFFARVEAAYHAMIDREPGRFIRLDATLPPETIGRLAAGEVIGRLMEAEHG